MLSNGSEWRLLESILVVFCLLIMPLVLGWDKRTSPCVERTIRLLTVPGMRYTGPSWYIVEEGVFHRRPILRVNPPTPLIGHIAFGVIDRGTNIIQVRPTTLCPHACIYCSVDAGPPSRTRQREIIVDPNWLVKHAVEVAEYKQVMVEHLIDGVGEPLTHPSITSIIRKLKQHPLTMRVAIETHGGFLSKPLINRLDRSGLDRINLSLDTLDPEKARLLSGVPWYDVKKIVKIIEYTVRETMIDVVLTPVVVPGVNEEDMKDLIELAKNLELGKKTGWPTGILIQKYEAHKYGRKPAKTREWTWHKFYKWLGKLEQETNYTLKPTMQQLGIQPARKLPVPHRRGEKTILTIVSPGWHHNEYLAINKQANRIIALYCRTGKCRPGTRINARITRSKDNIIVATK